ncbi:hypothetical protein [Cardinium endosymbiont of Tipula unca]|uniref:hypothetical protein n=1 Tax=Cardinium endosymbiont of Tipula unca TaxID=3066216 RepID=UPI0030D30928
MRILPCLIGIVVFMATSLKINPATASWRKENIATQRMCFQKNTVAAYEKIILPLFHAIQTEVNPSVDSDKPSDSLDEILKKDADSEGVMANILGGLSLCYNALANLLLYPIFSFLLLLLSLGALVLGVFLLKKARSKQPIATRWMIFTGLYILFYFDLFLVVFQKRKVLLLFLELERELLLTIVAALIGYVVGKFFSSKSFEEKELP